MSPLSKPGHVHAIQSLTPNMNGRARYTVVAIAICSWFAISNHCTFAALATKTDSGQTACPFHSKPAKEKQQSPQVQCCKVLRVVVVAKTKSWARDNSKVSDAGFRIEKFEHLALSHNAQALCSLDNGPPDGRSFAELILQRSLLAHAPPIVV